MTAITQKISNVNVIEPLKSKTLYTLEKYVFGFNRHLFDASLIGCYSRPSLAERTIYLKDLQDKFNAGTIDLGTKDRALALAKCIGIALLATALFVFTVVYMTSPLMTSPLIALAGTINSFLAVSIPIASVLGSSVLFAILRDGDLLSNASEVFKRPNPKQLEDLINQINNEKISDKNKQEIQNVEKKINEQLEAIKKLIDIANDTKNQPSDVNDNPCSFLFDLRRAQKQLEEALVDLQRFKAAIASRFVPAP